MNGRASLYETITNDIITELEKGVVPGYRRGKTARERSRFSPGTRRVATATEASMSSSSGGRPV